MTMIAARKASTPLTTRRPIESQATEVIAPHPPYFACLPTARASRRPTGLSTLGSASPVTTYLRTAMRPSVLSPPGSAALCTLSNCGPPSWRAAASSAAQCRNNKNSWCKG